MNWWKRRRAIKRAAKHDAYVQRLENSASGLCGLSHFGSEPFLEIGEVRNLIQKELDRVAYSEHSEREE